MVLPSIECEKWCRTNHGQKDKLPAASHLLYSTVVCLGQGIGRSTHGIRFNWRTVWMVKRKERKYGKRLNLGSGSGYLGILRHHSFQVNTHHCTRWVVALTNPTAGFTGQKRHAMPRWPCLSAVVPIRGQHPFWVNGPGPLRAEQNMWRTPRPRWQSYSATVGFDISLLARERNTRVGFWTARNKRSKFTLTS